SVHCPTTVCLSQSGSGGGGELATYLTGSSWSTEI
ncbi:MAG: hypothetical protein ACI96M_003939, partial [Candidatus Azotimanducaceae bacterium]